MFHHFRMSNALALVRFSCSCLQMCWGVSCTCRTLFLHQQLQLLASVFVVVSCPALGCALLSLSNLVHSCVVVMAWSTRIAAALLIRAVWYIATCEFQLRHQISIGSNTMYDMW